MQQLDFDQIVEMTIIFSYKLFIALYLWDFDQIVAHA